MGETTIPLNVAQQTLSLPTAGNLPPDVQILIAKVLTAPEDFFLPQRPVQMGGVLLPVTEHPQAVAFRAAQGVFTLSFAEQSPESFLKTETLLAPLKETGRPVTLLLQPKDGKIESFLLVPKDDDKTAAFPLSGREKALSPLPSGAGRQDPVLTEGKKLTVTVLSEEAGKALLPEKTQKEALLSLHQTSEQKKQAVQTNPSQNLSIEQAGKFADKQSKEIVSSLGSRLAHPPSLLPSEGSDARVQIARLLSPQESWPDVRAPHLVKAVALGKSLSGHQILKTEDQQTLLVRQEGKSPPGTKILLEVLPLERAEPLPLLDRPEKETEKLRGFMAALASSDPKAAQGFSQTRLPNPTERLSATLLFLLSAMKSGKLEEWVGRQTSLSMEKSGQRAALDALIDDLGAQTNPVRDSRGGEWRSWLLPLHNGAAYETIRLYVRESPFHDAKNSAGRPAALQTRFLISMNMSRLGAMQMDGLSQSKRLDLVIRSERPLPESLPKELRETYLKTLSALGMTGTLSFQSGEENWVRIGGGESGEVLI